VLCKLHLFKAAKSTVANRDVLIKLFGRIEGFFERLKVYTNIQPSPAMTDELAKIMAEVLSIFALATKGIKQGRISGSIFCLEPCLVYFLPEIFFKNVAGMSDDVEGALQRFGELEQRELLNGIAQVATDTTVLKDGA
jgi:hypothetical protein